MRRRRGGGSLGVFGRGLARRSRRKFQFALLLRVCPPCRMCGRYTRACWRARASLYDRWAVVRGSVCTWPRCVFGAMSHVGLRSRARVAHCGARVAGMCHGALTLSVCCMRGVAIEILWRYLLCEVASPDGAVGREWCYVEARPFKRAARAKHWRVFVRGRVRACAHASGRVCVFTRAGRNVCACARLLLHAGLNLVSSKRI